MTTEAQQSSHFDEFLDEQGQIEINGLKYWPSELLNRAAPEDYRASLTEFRQTIWPQRMGEIISTEYPRPVAYPFEKYADETLSPHERLLHLRDCWEGLLSVIFSLVFGECISSECSITNKEITLRKILSDRISDRISLIEAIVNEPERIDPKPLLIDYVDKTVLEKIGVLNREHRNVWSHENALTEAQIGRELETVESDFLELMESVIFLKDCKLLRYVRSGTRATNLVFESFSGSSLNTRNVTLPVSAGAIGEAAGWLRNDRLVCYSDGRFTGLAPFAHFREDEDGHLRRFLIYRRKGRGSHSGHFQYSAIAGPRTNYVPIAEFEKEMNLLRKCLGVPTPSEGASGKRDVKIEDTQ